MTESICAEDIEKNWVTYEKLCGRLCDAGVNSLLETMGERIIMCPSSTRIDSHGCHPGGMIKHSLDVTAKMRTLNESLCLNVSVSSILKAGLLHDIGKVGDDTHDLFLEQDSSWHRDKLGQMYKYNEDIQKMSVSHMSLYTLQRFGVNLTKDEWLAIQLAQGSHFEENRFYVHNEPTLALLLQQSKSVISHIHSNPNLKF